MALDKEAGAGVSQDLRGYQSVIDLDSGQLARHGTRAAYLPSPNISQAVRLSELELGTLRTHRLSSVVLSTGLCLEIFYDHAVL